MPLVRMPDNPRPVPGQDDPLGLFKMLGFLEGDPTVSRQNLGIPAFGDVEAARLLQARSTLPTAATLRGHANFAPDTGGSLVERLLAQSPRTSLIQPGAGAPSASRFAPTGAGGTPGATTPTLAGTGGAPGVTTPSLPMAPAPSPGRPSPAQAMGVPGPIGGGDLAFTRAMQESREGLRGPGNFMGALDQDRIIRNLLARLGGGMAGSAGSSTSSGIDLGSRGPGAEIGIQAHDFSAGPGPA